jgi:hypothetical protein
MMRRCGEGMSRLALSATAGALGHRTAPDGRPARPTPGGWARPETCREQIAPERLSPPQEP